MTTPAQAPGHALQTQSQPPLFAHPASTLSREQLDLLKRTVCRGASDDEFRIFLEVCQSRRVDPFSKMVYLVPRWDSKEGRMVMAIQSSIDYFRLTAERTSGYAGQLGPQWCGDDGEWKDVWLAAKAPRAARVAVLRHSFKEPLWSVALWDSYAQKDKGGNVTKFWQTMGPLMIGKCAEALAIRRAFPENLSGLYTAEEMAQAEPIEVEATVVTKPAQRGADVQRRVSIAAGAPDGVGVSPSAVVTATAGRGASTQPGTSSVGVAQKDEQRSSNPPDAGSNPAADTDASMVVRPDGDYTIMGLHVDRLLWDKRDEWLDTRCVSKQSTSKLAGYKWRDAIFGDVIREVPLNPPSKNGDRERAFRWGTDMGIKETAERGQTTLFCQRCAIALYLLLDKRVADLQEEFYERDQRKQEDVGQYDADEGPF